MPGSGIHRDASSVLGRADLDPSQRAVLDFARTPGPHALVVGAPGSGKTALAASLAVDAVAQGGLSPERVVVLAPTRIAAGTLEDRIAAASSRPSGARRAATPAAISWGILRSAAVLDDRPVPVLLSGAEQDDILRRLLAGHEASPARGPDWSGIVPIESLRLPGFRHELRDLFLRAEEAGLGPDELADWGARLGRREWRAAAAVFREYERTLALRRTASDQPERYDAAGIVSAAADALAAWEGADAPSWDLVVVDDAQDVTRATWTLLRVLAGVGTRIILIGDADASVQGYRGAVPHVVAQADLDPPSGFGARRFRLEGSYRLTPALRAVAVSVAERIGTARGFEGRDNGSRPSTSGEPAVEFVVSPHLAAEGRAIAARIRRLRHGLDGPPIGYSDIAVIARSRVRAAEVRAALAAVGVPVASVGDALPLRRDPVVAALVSLARISLGGGWTPERVEAVLGSKPIGLDGPGRRRLRRALVAEERAGGGTRLGADLLVEALGDPRRFETIRGTDARRARVAAVAVGAGSRAAAKPGATAASVLWAVWEALGVSESWRASALAGSEEDDRALDAAVALFRAAESHAARLPDARPAAFFDQLESEDFAPDTLAPRAISRDVVAVETPASAAGRQWEVVVLVGLEEGSWPNMRLRDSVLGATVLSDVVSGRTATGTVPESPATTAAEALRAARASVLDDELRWLYVAITRARRVVVACALEGEDDRPSRFLTLLGWRGGHDGAGRATGLADLRDAVVTLRAEATARPALERAGHVAALARLAAAGVPGADPSTWGGAVERSSVAPLVPNDRAVRVSPSRIDAAEACPLRAVLQSVGCDAEPGDARGVGSVFHRAASEYPAGPALAVDAAIDAAWPELEIPATWPGRRLRERVKAMTEAYAEYAERIAGEGWEIRVEEPFRVEVGDVVVAGRVDRLHVRDGVARVADLKTGAAPATKREAEASGQLAAYQLAVARGAFAGVSSVDGAELVYVADRGALRSQGALADADAVAARIGAVAAATRGSRFEARPSRDCARCPARRSCPAVPEGGQVSGR